MPFFVVFAFVEKL